jgi:hypothetical protein
MDRKPPTDRKHLLPWQRAVIDAFVRQGEIRVEADMALDPAPVLGRLLPPFRWPPPPGFDRGMLYAYDPRFPAVTPARAFVPPKPEHHVLVGGDDRGRHYGDALTRGTDIHERVARVLFDCEMPYRDIELRMLAAMGWKPQPPPRIERSLFTAALRGWSL